MAIAPTSSSLNRLFSVSRRNPAMVIRLTRHQRVQPLQVEGGARQAPLAGDRDQATQGELAEVQHLLDDAQDRFDGALAQAVDGLADGRLELRL